MGKEIPEWPRRNPDAEVLNNRHMSDAFPVTNFSEDSDRLEPVSQYIGIKICSQVS